MTDERFLILSACIWLAPHVPRGIAIINCCAMLLLAAAIGFGWMT
jgi:ABC-type multidrug transport system permease subunit